MKISPFTPLNFGDAGQSDGLQSRYIQVFAPTDQIMVQVVASTEESAPEATINDAHTGTVIDTIEWQEWEMNEDKVIYFTVISGLSLGHYTITVGDITCEEFRVTDDTVALAKTTLIQYRFKDNKQRDDVVSVIDYVPYFFDFRVPGGFKDSGWQFGVSNEQFTTQHEDLVELFAHDYTMKTFTMGGSIGVPVWFGEMLNRLLTCSYVYFDAVRYARSESETPQAQILIEGLDSFVFTQVLRAVRYIDEDAEVVNQTVLRRTEDNYRSVETNNEDVNRII